MNDFEVETMKLMVEVDRFVHLQSLSDLRFVKITNYQQKLLLDYSIRDVDLHQDYCFQVENVLICQPAEIQKQMPILRLVTPRLPPNVDAHILNAGTICYTFPGDLKYNMGLTCGYAVEQSFKWVFGYEFYLRKDYWPFAEMPHGIYPIHWGFSRPHIAA